MRGRTVTHHEMDRREAIVKARVSLTNAQLGHELTPLEWADVFNEMSRRMVQLGLTEEWKENQ